MKSFVFYIFPKTPHYFVLTAPLIWPNTDKFDDPNLPGEMTVTINLRAVSYGTDLRITQEGIAEIIPVGKLLSGLAAITREFSALSGAGDYRGVS